MTGGKPWVVVEAKSLEIVVENGKRLRGRNSEGCRGISTWIRLGDLSLQYLLSRVEACGREARNDG